MRRRTAFGGGGGGDGGGGDGDGDGEGGSGEGGLRNGTSGCLQKMLLIPWMMYWQADDEPRRLMKASLTGDTIWSRLRRMLLCVELS